MEFDNQVVLVISIGILISSITVKGADLSPFWSIADEVKDAFGPVLNEAEEAIDPSSVNLDKAKEALGPIPSFDEATKKLGPISLDDAKEALSPVVDDAKEKLGPISPSTMEKAKSATTKALDKVEEGFDSIASWISQNKVDVSSYLDIAQKELGPVSSSDLDKAKEVLAPVSPSLDKAGEALPPISPSVVDEAKDALGPVISSETIDEAKEKLGSITSALFSQNKEEISSSSSSSISSYYNDDDDDNEDASPPPASPSTLDEAEDAIGTGSSKALDEAKEAFGSITSFFSNNKVQISSELGPISSPESSPSTLEKAEEAIDAFSNKALDEAKDELGQISSFFSQNKEETSSYTAIYIDHDVALALESLIKQGQSNSELAIEEARKLLSVTETIASPDRGTCVKTCMDNYASCLDSFNKAMEELMARNAEQLTDDVSSVEGEILACQTCFMESKEEKQSSLKDLEEAIVKTTRECLNVLHHSV